MLFTNNGHLDIEGYYVANWAGNPDDMRSTNGYYVFVGGNLLRKAKSKLLLLYPVEKLIIG